jgi:hypothetical protein
LQDNYAKPKTYSGHALYLAMPQQGVLRKVSLFNDAPTGHAIQAIGKIKMP